VSRRVGVPAEVISGNRVSSREKAIVPSSRASAAPMQKWTPPAKLSGSFGAQRVKPVWLGEPARVSIARREQCHYPVTGPDGNPADPRLAADAAGELDG
jgi:hypothetical protein